MKYGLPTLCAIVMLITLLPVEGAAEKPIGWRNHGDGIYPDAKPADRYSKSEDTLWSTDLPSWSNASPIVVGDVVLTTAEPTLLIALDAHNGKILWQRDNLYTDTLALSEQEVMKQRLQDADKAARTLENKRQDLNRLKRKARSHTTSDKIHEELETLSRAVDALKRELDTMAPFRTPTDKGIVGYATATPISDGSFVYALFGNGVFSKFRLDGERIWSIYLGKNAEPMKGFHTGHAASPVLVDGVLITGVGHLQGVDPVSGRILWKGAVYRDFGTPAPIRLSSGWAVVTPSGDVIRARDGFPLARNIASQLYTGAVVHGDHIYFVGSGENTPQGTATTQALALRIVEKNGKLTVEKRWQGKPPVGPFFSTPILFDGRLYLVGKHRELLVYSMDTGRLLYQTELPLGAGEVFSSPIVAGDILFAASEQGVLAHVVPGGRFTLRGTSSIAPMRSTPFFVKERLYIRTLKGVVCLKKK